MADTPPYRIEVLKSRRVLRLMHADKIFRQFPVAWGRGGPGDKEKFGDNRTPIGIYRIAGFNESSPFHLFMRLNYPNVKDAFYGLKNGVITRTDFDRIIDSLKQGKLPPQDTALGGAIGIHGVGVETDKKLSIHAKVNWTQGCIALTNTDISELRHYVGVGTEVVIRE
jgi:murein L,D-transpeptidase YafK